MSDQGETATTGIWNLNELLGGPQPEASAEVTSPVAAATSVAEATPVTSTRPVAVTSPPAQPGATASPLRRVADIVPARPAPRPLPRLAGLPSRLQLASLMPLLTVIALAAVVLLAGAVGVNLGGVNTAGQSPTSDAAGGTQASAPMIPVAPVLPPVPPTPSPSPSEPSPSPSDSEADALAALYQLREQDQSTVVFDGQYVAQLASKIVGIVDPFQTTASGSHTFGAADILAEHLELRQQATPDAPVVLVLSTDFGRRYLYHGQPLWTTFALGEFDSADAVRSWCAAQFPQFSGDALSNRCLPVKLEPPHD